MRLPVNHISRPLARGILLALCGTMLSSCGMFAGDEPGLPLASDAGPAPRIGGMARYASPGPEADYPVVLGEPFWVGGQSYTPQDVLNYDEVGYLAFDRAGGSTISGAHHTLPLPSYVEVTSLESGRTILVRLERRGPMDGNELLALSQGALALLEAQPGTAVRVRRVNAPEEQRALLRSGQAAPQRMDTPMSLVEVLRRKLPGAPAPVPAMAAAQRPQSLGALPAPAHAAPQRQPAPRQQVATMGLPPLPGAQWSGRNPPAAAPASPPPQATRPPVAMRQPARPAVAAPPPASVVGGFIVQAGAYSSEAKAQQVARSVGGKVSRAGSVWRVRTGPFASRNAAEASLAKVRAAGYSEARIFTNG